jgi:hypothetical protein
MQEVIVASLKGQAGGEGGIVMKQIRGTHYMKVF